jgi:uncharacterized protein (TIGR03086 family)
MDVLVTINRVLDRTEVIVDKVEPSQLGNPTLCTEWSVRDIINHVTGGGTMFAECVEGPVPDDRLGQLMGGDNLGDDYKGAFHAMSARVRTSFATPGVLDKTVTLPFGVMPAGVALAIAIMDVTTHACDIAAATGQTFDDTALLEQALESGQQMIGPELRVPGVFDAEQPAPPDATAADKLLAFAGRKI